RLWLLSMLLLLLVVSSAVMAQAQQQQTLVPGTPVAGTLNKNNLLHVYTLQGTAGQSVTVTVSNVTKVPLALVLTDPSGSFVAQGYDLNITGTVELANVKLPTTGAYLVTIFKSAGVDSFTDVTFNLTAAIVGSVTPEATAQATLAPTVSGAT